MIFFFPFSFSSFLSVPTMVIVLYFILLNNGVISHREVKATFPYLIFPFKIIADIFFLTYLFFFLRRLTLVRSPPFLRHTKHSTKGETDAVFSYVVIQRGTRPPALVHSISSPESSDTETGRDSTISTASVGSELGSELSWPRIIAPPRKRSGHVLLDVCAASGRFISHFTYLTCSYSYSYSFFRSYHN